MASSIQQITAVTGMNLRNIPSRLGSSLVIVIGIAGVVGVLVALLAMAEGFRATLAGTGQPDRVMVLRSGSTDELSSTIGFDAVQVVAGTPGLARGADGMPLLVAENYMLTDVSRPGSTSPNNVVVRGTGTDVFAVRPEARIVAGRMFRPGLREVVVGRGARSEFAGLEVGDQVPVRGGSWPIVGVFETGGDVHESELWVDREVLASVARFPARSSITARLESVDAFNSFKDAISLDPRLTLQVQREPEFYASRSKSIEALIKGLGYAVAVIMAIGAVFGALNTMYAAVSTRTVEIGTLRALGFGAGPVVASVLLEAMVLALAGALIGGAAAYLFFNGMTVSTLNQATFSQVAFAFRVTPGLLITGAVWAVVIGLIGGLFPALRAARMPIADALRAN